MRTKRLVSLLLAFVMIFAISAPVAASTYDVTTGLPPATSWTLYRAYHWVTRGETLQDIAAMWAPETGVSVADIQFLNSRYFDDLARRNTTLGLNVQVEPGVRLHVGFILEARHYVRRGDTLAGLAGGSLVTPGGFPLITSVARIREQNAQWFAQLALWNATAAVNHELVESFVMIGISNALLPAGGPGTAPTGLIMSQWGAPLIIRVPVSVSAAPNPTEWIPLTALTYMANDREQVRQVSNWQWSPYHPPIASLYPSHPILGAVVGLVAAHGMPAFTATLLPGPDQYAFHPAAEAVGGGVAAGPEVRFTRPMDPQPAGAVALRVAVQGSGATVLANIAAGRGTTVAAIRAMNPAYFAYVNAAGVALEYRAYIWVPN